MKRSFCVSRVKTASKEVAKPLKSKGILHIGLTMDSLQRNQPQAFSNGSVAVQNCGFCGQKRGARRCLFINNVRQGLWPATGTTGKKRKRQAFQTSFMGFRPIMRQHNRERGCEGVITPKGGIPGANRELSRAAE
jgi:hypothetical protein